MQVSTFTTSAIEGTSTHAVMQLAPGKFYVKLLEFTPSRPYTAEELADMAESEAAYEAYDAQMRAQYGDMWEQGEMQHSCFTTVEAAQRATELIESMANASAEVSAFGAGGMGFELMACAPLERELEKLVAEFGWREPGSSIYDAEVRHQRVPIRELMPKGTPDSYGDDFVECCC